MISHLIITKQIIIMETVNIRCHSEAVLNGLKFLCEVTSDSKEVNSQGI